jgi:hypothetical protein
VHKEEFYVINVPLLFIHNKFIFHINLSKKSKIKSVVSSLKCLKRYYYLTRKTLLDYRHLWKCADPELEKQIRCFPYA